MTYELPQIPNDTGPFRSERIVVATSGPQPRKLFQILFGKKDGSIFVDFPFYLNTEGIASQLAFGAGAGQRELSLVDQGKVTSHLVKYSHHPDGRAHFSQDGKVFTMVKRQSVRLEDASGHLFTVLCIGLGNFAAAAPDDLTTATRKKNCVRFSVSSNARAVRFIGMVYSLTELRARSNGNPLTRWTTTVDSDGTRREAAICAPPLGRPGQFKPLVLSMQEMPEFVVAKLSTLIFLGGFDSKSVAYDHAQDTSFLALMYPADNIEQLKTQIGSMDFMPAKTTL